MKILGIDPGLHGALVTLDFDGVTLDILRMPTKRNPEDKGAKVILDPIPIASWLDSRSGEIHSAIIEDVGSRPRQQGQFLFGLNTGIVHGMMYANMIPFEKLLPRVWKDRLGLCRVNKQQTKAELKTLARQKATELFPKYSKEFSRVKDDGVAEAALLAYCGLLHVRMLKKIKQALGEL